MTVERSQKISHTCWRCREPVSGPTCASCDVIQPPPADGDLFAMLGLARAWFLDPRAVESAYRALSRRVHPDRFVHKSAVERRMSLQWTAAINEARRVLKDDTARAWFLATGSAQPPEEGGPALDPDFMETVFDLQLEAASDPTGVAERGAALRTAEWARLEAAFRAWEAGQATLDGVPAVLSRLKYIDNIVRTAAAAAAAAD